MRNNGDTFEHALWDRSTYKIDLNGKEPKVKKTEDKKTRRLNWKFIREKILHPQKWSPRKDIAMK